MYQAIPTVEEGSGFLKWEQIVKDIFFNYFKTTSTGINSEQALKIVGLHNLEWIIITQSVHQTIPPAKEVVSTMKNQKLL